MPVVVAGVANAAYRVSRFVRMKRCFASEEFQAHTREVAALVAEHNEISSYTTEIRTRGTCTIGGSTAGAQAHLATFQNTSQCRPAGPPHEVLQRQG